MNNDYKGLFYGAELQKQALKLKKTYALCYNTTICYYRLRQYENMKNLLETAITLFDETDAQPESLREMLGLAAAVFADKQTALSMLSELERSSTYGKNSQTLKLAYLCGDYSFIFRNYKEIFSLWIMDSDDYKILLSAFRNSNIEQMNEFNTWIENNVLKFYSEDPDYERDYDLLNTIKNRDCNTKIEVSFNPLFSCDFY